MKKEPSQTFHLYIWFGFYSSGRETEGGGGTLETFQKHVEFISFFFLLQFGKKEKDVMQEVTARKTGCFNIDPTNPMCY